MTPWAVIAVGLICLLAAPVYAQPTQLPENVTLLADSVTYEQDETVIAATGNVNILSPQGNVWADEISYNLKKQTLIAEGNVIFVDNNDDAIFVDRLQLNQAMETGVLEAFRIRLANNGPALAAEKAEKTDAHTISLVNAAYSPCPTCKKQADETEDNDTPLPWKIRAGEITYNSDKKNITYRNAVLDVYGMPVVYLPYFRHPVGHQTAQTGLLPPRFGSSTNRGEEVTLGYYIRQNAYEDYTFRTRAMSTRGVQLQAQRRYNGTRFSNEIFGSVLEDDLTGSLRSHVELNGTYVLQPGRRIGAYGQLASDDTYLDDFFERTDSFLPSTLYAEDASRDHYAAIHGTFYQDLRQGKDPGQTAQVLPRFQIEKVYRLGNDGKQIKMSAEGLSLHRSEGAKSRRLVAQAEFHKPYMTQDGHHFNLSARLRGDIYQVESAGTATGGQDGTHGRVLPQVSLKWERPYMSPDGAHKITPKAMVIAAPRGGNPDEIPNEDSVAYELDPSNLFDTNRFAGLDRVESGPRVVYGLDNQWGTPNSINWQLFVGQSYRLFDDSTLPALGGTQTKASDWVGHAQMRPYSWLSLSNRFRLDNADFEARRMDTGLMLGENREDSHLLVTHSLLEGGPEEIHLTGRYEFNEKYAFEAEARRDLRDDGKLLESEGAFIYSHSCYRVTFSARRRGFNNRNVPPSTDYLLNLELLTLGRDRAD